METNIRLLLTSVQCSPAFLRIYFHKNTFRHARIAQHKAIYLIRLKRSIEEKAGMKNDWKRSLKYLKTFFGCLSFNSRTFSVPNRFQVNSCSINGKKFFFILLPAKLDKKKCRVSSKFWFMLQVVQYLYKI